MEIPAPLCVLLDHCHNTGLGLLENCLCDLTKQADNLGLWVMNEYGSVIMEQKVCINVTVYSLICDRS